MPTSVSHEGKVRLARAWIVAGVGATVVVAASAVWATDAEGPGSASDPAGAPAQAVPTPTFESPRGLSSAPETTFRGVSGATLAGVRDALADRPSHIQEPPPEWHEFYFTRAAYSSGGAWGRRSRAWSTDYPKADRQFITVLKRLSNIDAYDFENAILLTNPGIRRFPFLYALEVGYMTLSPAEIQGLRDYLDAGGFLVIDDFWGSREWLQFEYQMSLVFPDRPIVDLELDHPVFSTYYEIDEILQVPAYQRWGGRTWEQDGYVPYVKGILDDDGRLLVMINWNTDLGDAWEWAEQPDYPLQFSTFAYQMGVNMIVYAMSH